jgi:hypothetical protein
MGRLCSRLLGQKAGWRTFCSHGTNFIEHYACRGTRLIGATNLSPVTNSGACTGAVSRRAPCERSELRGCKLSRSQKFNCFEMRVSGCTYHYKFVLGA